MIPQHLRKTDTGAPSGRYSLAVAAAVLSVSLLGPAPVRGQTPLEQRVLVVYNSSAADSLAVARHYMSQRHIPEGNLCRIAIDQVDYIKQSDYESRVRAPLRKCVESVGKRKVLYIVFSYQTPYVVTFGERGFALDSFVADLWDEYSDTRPGNEVASHPYFGEAQSQGNVYMPYVPLAAWRDQPQARNIYSVWRLDAANAALAKGLVDKALYAEAHGLSGKGCFDLQFGGVEGLPDNGPAAGDWDIHQAAEMARRAGFEVVEDDTRAEFGTPPAPARCDGAALYAGWYSLSHYNDAFTWNPGAIGFHLDSASATNPRGGPNWSASAVQKGITVTSGAAGEPYLEGLPHPDQVFLYLFQGANVGDAFLRATRWLKWMNLNIGDPLYRPFPKGTPDRLSGKPEAMLALMPHALVGGFAGSGTVVLGGPAPQGGAVVTLKSEQPEIVSVPRTVMVPAAAVSARFSFVTHAVNATTAARVSMEAGELHRSNTLVVHPYLQPLALGAAKIAGGAVVTATIVLSQQAAAETVIVKLSSDHPALVSIPAEVRVPVGGNRATFQIATRAVTGETAVVITASAGGSARTAILTVTP
jgi:uncharacterized protein (TIGR03790 family)